MKRVGALLLSAGTLGACGPDVAVQTPKKPVGEMIAVPPFEIRVILSDVAWAKLESSGETIKASISFDGEGTPLPNVKSAPNRAVYLGSHAVELKRPGIVGVVDAQISEEASRRLSDSNYHFFINVVSGRQVFENNVLSCGVPMGRLADLKNQTVPITVRCGLLG